MEPTEDELALLNTAGFTIITNHDEWWTAKNPTTNRLVVGFGAGFTYRCIHDFATRSSKTLKSALKFLK